MSRSIKKESWYREALAPLKVPEFLGLEREGAAGDWLGGPSDFKRGILERLIPQMRELLEALSTQECASPEAMGAILGKLNELESLIQQEISA